MKPMRITVALSPSADNDGLATAQSRSNAGAFTLDGVLVVSGVGIPDSNLNARQIVFNSSAAETGTFRVTGTIMKYGSSVTEVILAAGTSQALVNYFFTVTGITSDGGTVGAVSWGTSNVGASAILPLDFYQNPFMVGVSADLYTGSANFTLQTTQDSVLDPASVPLWFDDATFASKSADFQGKLTADQPAQAMRMKINSGAGTVIVSVVQAGAGS